MPRLSCGLFSIPSVTEVHHASLIRRKLSSSSVTKLGSRDYVVYNNASLHRTVVSIIVAKRQDRR